MRCLNSYCKNDPQDSPHRIHVGDGYYVCNEKCLKEYKKQEEEFFQNIHNDKWYAKWLKE